MINKITIKVIGLAVMVYRLQKKGGWVPSQNSKIFGSYNETARTHVNIYNKLKETKKVQ